MPTNIQELADTLKGKSSIRYLPPELQSSALKILEHIRTCNLKHVQLKATELRKQVKMDPHRYHPLFKWLRNQGYCDTAKGAITRASKKSGKTRRYGVKLVDITKAGEVILGISHTLGHLKEIAQALCRAESPDEETKLVLDLIVEAFDLAYTEFHYAGKLEDFEDLIGGLEEELRKHLDKEIGDKIGLTHDAYLSIIRIPSHPLLEDAKLAKEKGHFLTQNHRYVLSKMEHVKSKDLIYHNAQWRNNIMMMEFTGDESYPHFQSLVDPWDIVERERNDRGTPNLSIPSRMMFPRDSYDERDEWKLDLDELIRRYKQKQQNQGKGIYSLNLTTLDDDGSIESKDKTEKGQNDI